MSGTVDSLSIKINASAKGANQQLDKLVEKMVLLRSTINGINVGNLNSLSTSIQNFSKAASGLSQVKTADFTRMAKGIEKLSNIRKGELNRAAIAITNISKACSKIGNVSDGANKIAQLAQGISRLGYKSTTQAIQNIPLLTKELKNMMTELSKAPTVSDNLIAMTNAMANLGAQASGIRSVGSTMNNAGRSGNSFFGIMRKGVSNIRNFVSGIHSATKHNRSFAATLGLLYAKFWTLRRILGAFGSAVKASMNYIEEYNYFNTTMEKIASEWDKDFSKFGYKNADAYGKSFEDRLTKMMHKMTGFKMNRTGTVTDSGIKNLGLDVTQMTNYAAGVAQVTNSVGMTGEASIATSKALSMLAGDMSSFKNLDMQTVMNNFSSGLIGQSRALYKYGIDITNATLATYAHELGIKKDISAMEQNEKMQLRMIAILDQSKVSWGDLAKTINSPSNQVRLLQNNFKSLSRTIGDMFLPVVAKVLPYVNGLVIAIRRLFEWTASMLGIDLKDVIGNSGGGYSDIFDGLDDDADDASNAIDGVADSADKAAASQKKLNKQLQSFDQLNNMTTTKTTKKDTSSDKDSSPIDLTDQLNAALADYEKVWNEAYDNMTNDAEKFADKLTKLFKKAWTSGDGSDIGSAVAGWLNKGIDWVNKNWSVADEKVQKIANILATAVNGFTYEFDWSGLGTALSSTLQTYLNGKTTFFDNTDWTALGEGIATSLNSFIGNGENGPIQSYLVSLGSELKAAIEFAFGTIKTFDFSGLGKALGDGINKFFDKMGETNPDTQKTGWETLAIDISEGIKGIATTITTALGTVKWEDVGQAIADFIKNMDTSGIGWELGSLVNSMTTSFYELVSNKETWSNLGTKLKDGLNSFFESMNIKNDNGMTGWQSLGKGISDTLSGIATSLTIALDNDAMWNDVGQSIADFLTSVKWLQLTWDFAKLALAVIKGIGTAITKQVKSGHPVTAVLTLAGSSWALKKGWKKILSTFLGKKIAASSIGVAIGKVSAKIKKWVIGKGSKGVKALISTIKGGIGKVTVTLGKVWTSIKAWAVSKFPAITGGTKATGITGSIISFLTKKVGKVTLPATNVGISVSWGQILGFAGLATLLIQEAEKYNQDFEKAGKTIGTQIYNGMVAVLKFVTGYDLVAAIVDGIFGKGSSEEGIKEVTKATDNFMSNLQKVFKTAMSGGKNGTPDLQGAFNLLMTGGEDGKPIFTAKVKYEADEKSVKEVKNKIPKDKTVTATFDAKVAKQKKQEWIDIYKKFNSTNSKTVMATFKAKKDKTWEKDYKKYKNLASKSVNWKIKTMYENEATKAFMNSPLANKKTLLKKTLQLDIQVLKNSKNAADRVTGDALEKIFGNKKANGGIFSGGSWHNITKYANGGLPNMGQMFVAREAGPELVGTIGGHTAVMNNNQIVASVSDGVFNALNPVLTYLCNSINALNGRMDNMGYGMSVEKYTEGDLLKVVRKENSNYRRRTGKGAFD